MAEVTERSIKLLDWGAVGEPAVEDGDARTLLCHSSAYRKVREYSGKQITPSHSITSSARARSVGGIVRLSALAVLTFRRSSNVVGICTGRSPGFAPLRIRST